MDKDGNHESIHRLFQRLALCGCVLSACEHPAQPTEMLPLPPGSYVLAASVHSFVQGGSDCSGSGTYDGVSHSSYVTLTQDGSMWVVRSESAQDGDAELRFVAKCSGSDRCRLWVFRQGALQPCDLGGPEG